MSSYEFVEWMAFLKIEEYERDRMVKEQEAKAKQSGMLGG